MFAHSQKQAMKRDMVLDRLKSLGVRETQQRKSIYEADYEELKYELVLAEMKNVEVANEAAKWF